MIFYLRNKKNKTIFELEFWTKTDYNKDGSEYTYHEISTTLDIKEYSEYLLSVSEGSQDVIVRLFSELDELRGWLWENYYMVKKNTGSDDDYNEIYKILNDMFSTIDRTFNLYYVTD